MIVPKKILSVVLTVTAILTPFLLFVDQAKTIYEYVYLGLSNAVEFVAGTKLVRESTANRLIYQAYPNIKPCKKKGIAFDSDADGMATDLLIKFQECFGDNGALQRYQNQNQGASTPIDPWMMAVFLNNKDAKYELVGEFGLDHGPYQIFEIVGPFIVRRISSGDWRADELKIYMLKNRKPFYIGSLLNRYDNEPFFEYDKNSKTLVVKTDEGKFRYRFLNKYVSSSSDVEKIDLLKMISIFEMSRVLYYTKRKNLMYGDREIPLTWNDIGWQTVGSGVLNMFAHERIASELNCEYEGFAVMKKITGEHVPDPRKDPNVHCELSSGSSGSGAGYVGIKLKVKMLSPDDMEWKKLE